MTNGLDRAASAPEGNPGLTTQTVAVAVASAVMFFAVVGLIVSNGSSPQLSVDGAAPARAVLVPETVRPVIDSPSLEAGQMSTHGDLMGGAFSLTVPANSAVVVDLEMPDADPDGSGGVGVWIPPLAPGHHILSVGMHEIVVTAVEE